MSFNYQDKSHKINYLLYSNGLIHLKLVMSHTKIFKMQLQQLNPIMIIKNKLIL